MSWPAAGTRRTGPRITSFPPRSTPSASSTVPAATTTSPRRAPTRTRAPTGRTWERTSTPSTRPPRVPWTGPARPRPTWWKRRSAPAGQRGVAVELRRDRHDREPGQGDGWTERDPLLPVGDPRQDKRRHAVDRVALGARPGTGPVLERHGGGEDPEHEDRQLLSAGVRQRYSHRGGRQLCKQLQGLGDTSEAPLGASCGRTYGDPFGPWPDGAG